MDFYRNIGVVLMSFNYKYDLTSEQSRVRKRSNSAFSAGDLPRQSASARRAARALNSAGRSYIRT